MIRSAKLGTVPIFSLEDARESQGLSAGTLVLGSRTKPPRRAVVILQSATQPLGPFGHTFGHKCSSWSSATEPCQGVGAHGTQDK